METRTNENGTARKKPRFNFARAARAFREARMARGEPKVEMTDEEGRPIRHVGGGRWVLRESPEDAGTTRKKGRSTPTPDR